MDFEKIRSSFVIYVVDSDATLCDTLTTYLQDVGYLAESYMRGEDALEKIKEKPPHVVVFGTYLMGMTGLQFVERAKELSSEIHLVIMANYAESDLASEALSLGARDRINRPIQNPSDLLSVVDGAIEKLYLSYSNEALYLATKNAKAATRRLRRRFFSEREILQMPSRVLRNLQRTQDSNLIIEELVRTISHELSVLKPSTNVNFFKYLPNQKGFICTHSSNGASKGLQIPEQGATDTEGIREILSIHFGGNEFEYRLIGLNEKWLGLVVVESTMRDPVIRNAFDQSLEVFKCQYSLSEATKSLHENLIRDPLTGVWVKAEIERRLQDEISRSRRLKMPVSVLMLGLDQADALRASMSENHFDHLIQKLAIILLRTSRCTDIIGRISGFEFAAILPHTNRMGAAVKAEKLRRLIEKSTILDLNAELPSLTVRVSIGVSEYPSLSVDAETLWVSADSAYFQVKRIGNRVCLAAAPKNFEADFKVVENISESLGLSLPL